LAGFINRLLGYAENVFAAAIIPFGGGDNFFVTRRGGSTGSNSCHAKSPLRVRHETLNNTGICITEDHGATRLALHFLGTTTEIVLEKRGTATNLARCGQTKTFFRTAFGFHFGHFNLISIGVV
jgi:hypothetical protein